MSASYIIAVVILASVVFDLHTCGFVYSSCCGCNSKNVNSVIEEALPYETPRLVWILRAIVFNISFALATC